MSDSSDEGETFQLRDPSDDSDYERPNKRRRTTQQPALRAKGLGFVSATAEDVNEEEENDPDDERPTMGGNLGLNSVSSALNIGEYDDEIQPKSPSPDLDSGAQTPNTSGRGPSAFNANGKIQKTSFAARMMAKMGHVEGQGLGKTGQGISAPIQAQLLQSRAGLGHGSVPASSKPSKVKRQSQSSTPGASSPRRKAPPKKKYEVAAIESRGLHIPEAMKSIIIDATGAETRTVSSLSGFSTPNSDAPQQSEASKAAARIKLQLQAYADAWDATVEQESRLEQEGMGLQAATELHKQEEQKLTDIVSSFDRVSMDDSGQAREWPAVIERLRALQDRFADHIEDLSLPEICASCLEAPFRQELVDWEPLVDPTKFISSFESIGALLDLEKSNRSRNRKRTTPFETLLVLHWFPCVRMAMRDWSVYDPEPAVALVQLWQSILPPWLLYRLLHEVIIPKLIEGVRRFPRLVESRSHIVPNGGTSSSKNRTAPELHSWLFEWWSLVSSEDLSLERFKELRALVKSKVDISTWPTWKPLLGSKKQSEKKQKPISTSSLPSTPAAAAMGGVSFKDIVEEWCSENNLLLLSTGRSDAIGRLLYRLQDADRGGKGILIYLQGDVVFSEEGEPFGLDDVLATKARGR